MARTEYIRPASGSTLMQLNMRASKAAYRRCMHDIEEFRCYTCMVVLHPYEIGLLEGLKVELSEAPRIEYTQWGETAFQRFV